MIDTLLELIAPHHCCSCQKAGALLCDNCKYDITSEPYESCVACGRGLVGNRGVCGSCQVPYQRAWCAGLRSDGLEQLIDNYKFDYARAAHRPLADLLDAVLPVLPEGTVVVPVPTVSSHIRQRGYDHMLLIARQLARQRGLQLSTDLRRVTSTKQRDAGFRLRTKQAKEAFRCSVELSADVPYLLVDDVITTGATMKYAAKALQAAGARTVWIASVSRQPLD